MQLGQYMQNTGLCFIGRRTPHKQSCTRKTDALFVVLVLEIGGALSVSPVCSASTT